MKIDGVSAIAVILIASFTIDRLVPAILFLLRFAESWRGLLPDPAGLEGEAHAAAERKQKLAYFTLAGVLGIALLAGLGKVRILRAAGFLDVPWWLDTLVTGLVLMGGADRVASLLGAGGALGGKTAEQPIQITGKLVLEDSGGKLLARTDDAPTDPTAT